MSNAIEISNLSYSYKSNWVFKSISALKSISLDVLEGEAFGFLGPNGAGKTTTIKCILGLIKPSKGYISILGIDSRKTESRKSVGYLPEQPYFYDNLSVFEILEMYAHLAGVDSRNIKNFLNEAAEKVKINSRLKSSMRSLSKGLTQRVALAQAIIAKPKVLILDEPFSGLDPLGRREFKEIILELKNLGTTILMSSHILSDVEFLCNRASIIVKGELKGVFDLSKLQKTNTKAYELIITTSNNCEAEFIELADSVHKENNQMRIIIKKQELANLALKKCLDNNYQIDSFTQQHAGLEDIFVDVVNQAQEVITE